MLPLFWEVTIKGKNYSVIPDGHGDVACLSVYLFSNTKLTSNTGVVSQTVARQKENIPENSGRKTTTYSKI